jgi:alpha-tubulin suppressor-like RCC1 family protein
MATIQILNHISPICSLCVLSVSLTLPSHAFLSLSCPARGKIYSWGAGGHGRLGHGDTKPQSKPKLIEALSKMEHKFVDVAVGYDHSIAITDKGVLVSWGAGSHGELGQKTCNRQLQAKVIPISEKVAFKSASVGYEFTTAVSVDGDLYAWGNNANGRVGNGKTDGLQVEPLKIDCDLMLKYAPRSLRFNPTLPHLPCVFLFITALCSVDTITALLLEAV